MKNIATYLLLLVSLLSCSKRNLLYFSSTEERAVKMEHHINNSNNIDPKIQPNDLLSITVTSLSAEANVLFNKGEVIPVGNSGGYSNNGPNVYSEGYLVDKEGFIDFPVLGRIQLGGITKAEAKARINSKLVRYLKEPVVNIRFLNFRVTVVGEVSRPSTFTIPSEKITILEALGMAGDLTIYGKRENVLLIREEGGEKTLVRLNLNSKELLDSPYFYLQQNDVIYVEPNKAKIAQASSTRNDISLGLSIVSILSIILTRFL
ncbi:polysaccharide biosynthesis/export family protein [Nafulsella turpanensis]|uniref:polysaccharide biosynthesis/export family protein n=1 Tax=Nafulsella turpanensis TaxID=1265690 RepID=UPI000475E968|nr:polysaccharide biosynthesis/export family protein [Nafulsella turpanensis]